MDIITISDYCVWLTSPRSSRSLGVLAMLFVPSEDEATIKRWPSSPPPSTFVVGIVVAFQFDYDKAGNAAVLRQRTSGSTSSTSQLHDRARRDQPAAVRAVGLHHPRGDDLHVGQHARGREPQGVRHHDADPAGGHGRHVHGPGPDPVLRVLRGRAAADVLHHRRVGRRAAPVRLAEVLPLHDVRLGADAGGVPGPVRPDRRRELLARSTSPSWARTSGAPCRSGSSPGCSSASPSRCRCSRSTPGCPTPTPRRRPRAR